MNTTRRRFLKGSVAAGAILAAPFVTTSPTFGQSLPVRRDLQTLSLTDRFFTDYAAAITAMHNLPASDSRNWRNQALIHLNHCPHGDINFFPWHRWYIYFYEKICADLCGNPDFTLPYWNWSLNEGKIPLPFYSMDPTKTAALNVVYWEDPSNASSPNWDDDAQVSTIGIRTLPPSSGVEAIYPSIFSETAISDDLALTDFTQQFWPQIEGSPHNTAHVLVGGRKGHMGDGMSPLDPIFWLHHCNVDRMWAIWQSRGNVTPPIDSSNSNRSVYKDQFVDADGTPQPQPIATNSYDFRTINGAGYTYESLEGVSIVATPLVGLAAPMVEFKPTTPSVIGLASNAAASSVNATTSIDVTAKGVLDGLFARRIFRTFGSTVAAPRTGLESGRILARFSEIKTDKSLNGMLVKVFVNTPDVGSSTPTTNANFAGAFSFFGFGAGGHPHHAFVVDLTDALRAQAERGAFGADQISVQLVPQAFDTGMSDLSFTVGKVELISG